MHQRAEKISLDIKIVKLDYPDFLLLPHETTMAYILKTQN